MTKVFLYYSLLFVLFVSCSRDTINNKICVINADFKKNIDVNLSEIATSCKVVKLETTDKCLFSSVSNVCITEKYIFILSKRVLQFTRKGKFIRFIGNTGRGPFEYNFINSFNCDMENERVYIASPPNILCYSFDGKPLFSIKQNNIIDFIGLQNNNLLLFYTKYERRNNSIFSNVQYLSRYNSEGKLIDSVKLKEIRQHGTWSATTIKKMHYVSNTFNGIFFYYPAWINEAVVRDTLYQIQNDKCTPSVKIDFEEKAPPPHNSNKKGIFINNIFRTNRYLCADYFTFDKDHYFLCYDFMNNKQYNIKNGINDDFNNTGKVFLNQLNTKDDYMYYVKDAFEVCDKIDGLTEESNPVIFLVKLKD